MQYKYRCRDVFPYGIYMLAYEYFSRKLSESNWVHEKRKKIKDLQKQAKKHTYIDISIPILSGAFAGMDMFSNERVFCSTICRDIRTNWTINENFPCRFYVVDFSDSIWCHKNNRSSWNESHQTRRYVPNIQSKNCCEHFFDRLSFGGFYIYFLISQISFSP